MSYFDHFADARATPLGQWIVLASKRHHVRLFTRLVPDRASAILELGPGKGDLARLLLREGYHTYTGVEPNPQMCAALARLGVATRSYMAPRLEEPDAAYDAIIADNIFEHLAGTPEAQVFIEEARRVLRPGGHLFIASPDYLHWREDFFNCDYTHANVTTVRRTIQLFTNNGFTPRTWVYTSGFLHGPAATAASHLARLLGFALDSNGLDQKLYKLKLTFLRQFLIVGTREVR